MLHTCINLAFIGQAVSEKIFEHYGNIHIYSREVGVADQPLESNFSHSNAWASYVDLAIK